MHIMVIGICGFPGIEGGMESHSENLFPLLVDLGCDVEAIVRSPYWTKDNLSSWKGVHFRSLWSPSKCLKSLENPLHSFLCLIYAGLKRPEILHIHGIGAALMAPLARIAGLRVVLTHHGPDYESEKWGFLARWSLRIGERFGVLFSNKCIVVSEVIKTIISNKYNREAIVIPNGVQVPALPSTKIALKRYGLKSRRYVLQVSRFAAHKRQNDLIRAFSKANLEGWKLALVGAYDSKDEYTKEVLALGKKNSNIIFTGFQTGLALKELYANAGVFVLPSSYEGLPIALLEALSYGLPVLVSDIPAHLEVGLHSEQYFPLGNVEVLSEKIKALQTLRFDSQKQRLLRAWVKKKYNWRQISEKVFTVYENVAN